MATALPGHLVADIRGRVGDVVFTRTRGGLTIRKWLLPDETETDPRKRTRDAHSIIVHAWSGTLTEAQRTAWRTYAAQHPKHNRFGLPMRQSGYCCFVAHNEQWCPTYYPDILPDAPIAEPLPRPYAALSCWSGNGYVTIEWPIASYDPPDAKTHFWAYLGKPANAGVSSYYGPWSYADHNWYDGGWQTNPWRITIPGGIAAGKQIWLRLVAQNYTTRAISTHSQLRCTAQ